MRSSLIREMISWTVYIQSAAKLTQLSNKAKNN